MLSAGLLSLVLIVYCVNTIALSNCMMTGSSKMWVLKYQPGVGAGEHASCQPVWQEGQEAWLQLLPDSGF